HRVVGWLHRGIGDLTLEHAKPGFACESDGGRVHVHSVDDPSFRFRGRLKCPHIAADLQRPTGMPHQPGQASGLSTVAALLRLEETFQYPLIESFARIQIDQIAAALTRVPVDRAALPAAAETDWRILGEDHAIHQEARRSARTEPANVEFPQLLELPRDGFPRCDLVVVGTVAHRAGSELVGRVHTAILRARTMPFSRSEGTP